MGTKIVGFVCAAKYKSLIILLQMRVLAHCRDVPGEFL